LTGRFLLDWAIMALSLFNAILLIWLGLTVLLNAERRGRPRAAGAPRSPRWGIWVAGGGLLLGGAFFVSHSALLGHGPSYVSRGMDFWWHVGWIPVVALPFVWYVMMLWYAGFWEQQDTPLRRRHRLWFVLSVVLAAGLMGLLLFAAALPPFWQMANLKLAAPPSLGGVSLLIWIYPLYVLLCIALSVDALRRPGPSARAMGDLARRRARPWLMATSVTLLLVGLLVTWVVVWIAVGARQGGRGSDYAGLALTVGQFDLIISALISGAIILLGQAVVSYEVFTGKTLPRRGLVRHWRRALILAAGYSGVVGWASTVQLRPIYSLLLTALLMVAFYGLLVWRSYAERERYIEHLRPFVASQQLYERLLARSTGSDVGKVDVGIPFAALCQDVLGTRLAYLAAVGPLAPLAGPPLAYPQGFDPPALSLAELAARFDAPQTMCVPLDPLQHGGARWGVPLWSERGLIGLLLLGEKRDGGLYTQEEIEIARATGERLIDTQASGEMARRLMALERERLAQSQVLDRQARRALHDEVLPNLHAAMLTLRGEGGSPETIALLGEVHAQISELLREMPAMTAPQVKRWGLIGALRRLVAEEFGAAFDRVTWEVEPAAERQAEGLSPLAAEVLFYAARETIRNAALHGRGGEAARPLHLRICAVWAGGLKLVVEDDGVGLGDGAGARSGQGLALHSTMLAVVGGALTVESEPGAWTRVLLRLPPEGQYERNRVTIRPGGLQ